jgi:hypothetical protein
VLLLLLLLEPELPVELPDFAAFVDFEFVLASP